MMNKQTIYALDFDGVICDSAIETSITGWKVAQQIWEDMPADSAPKPLINAFRQIRPYLETGYEAILIMRLLYLGLSAEEFIADYDKHIKALIHTDNLEINQLKQLFGETRDQWISHDAKEWIRMNPLFTGIAEKLKSLGNRTWYIITTKQERFVEAILHANQISIDKTRIFGMDRQMSKQQTLLLLQQQHPNQAIIFIEDRLPTLKGIAKNASLQVMTLQLVDWGYNTASDRQSITDTPIQLIGLTDFIAD